jgi:hypothetical protein
MGKVPVDSVALNRRMFGAVRVNYLQSEEEETGLTQSTPR